MGVKEDDIKSFIDNNYNEIVRRFIKIEGTFFSKPEYPLINNQQIDRAIINEDRKIAALIECKGTGGVNALVDGIGQATQCAYHIKKNINNEFLDGCKAFLAIPKEMLQAVDLKLFSFQDIGILLVDLETNTVELYKEKAYFSEEIGQWITINPYYFRDSSLEGMYFYLHMMLKNLGFDRKDRLTLKQMEDKIQGTRRKNGFEDFFGDVRNNHIIPSVLGMYDEKERIPSDKGYRFARKTFREFCKSIVTDELGEYSQTVVTAIMKAASRKKAEEEYYEIRTEEILDEIKNLYGGKKVTYLFDQDNGSRNVLTMIRMLETIGAVSRSGNYRIKVNYFPFRGMPFLMERYDRGRLAAWFKEFDMPLP